jgi:hypothetical protein
MKKNEVIQAIACANVPAGTQLVQHSIGEGHTIAPMTAETGFDGLKILSAQGVVDFLELKTGDLSDTPDSKLFERIHQELLRFNTMIIGDLLFAGPIEEEAIAEHRVSIAKLQEIAAQLGITYNAPKDDLLK